MQSPIYWHPRLYAFAMRLLYGKYYHLRYQQLAELIPAGSSVVELCMGDAYLYESFLKQKNVRYTGLDINPVFIKQARKKGIDCKLCDVRFEDIQSADIVIMQASLYHFLPDAELMINKMLAAATKQVIIAEPVNNLSQSTNIIIRSLAKLFSVTLGGKASHRFNEESFTTLVKKQNTLKKLFYLDGGKEMVAVFSIL